MIYKYFTSCMLNEINASARINPVVDNHKYLCLYIHYSLNTRGYFFALSAPISRIARLS